MRCGRRHRRKSWIRKGVSMGEIIVKATGEEGQQSGGVVRRAGERSNAAGGVMRGTRVEWLYLVIALVGGIIGGAVSNRLTAAVPAVAAQVPGAVAATPAKAIAAQEITLVDAKGKPRAMLQLNDDGLPVFRMYD